MFEKAKAQLKKQLTQGATPRELALTVAFAVVLGVFPLIGFTTLLCFAFALVFRLNQPIIQVLNYVVAPLQLILIPVFLMIGEFLFGAEHTSINPVKMVEAFSNDWRGFLVEYGMAGAYAVFAWSICAPIGGFIIFRVMKPLLERMKRKAAQ
ncbi:MAG: DUF2062 domain-containing protein [Bdellovibrionota bacterium]